MREHGGAANSNTRTNQKHQNSINFIKRPWLETVKEDIVHIKNIEETKWILFNI